MRNLKRVLSLSLALVMVLGLMIVGTGASAADFTDQDEIVNEDAVNTLVALNIIAGKDDGSYFDPTGIVTRGEMAKMICIALNGGIEPVLGSGSSFTDTANHWASSYIEYCVNLKIVAGRGNGTFDPNATVTATEAAKMLLVAMNYDPTVFGLVGDSWDINTNTEANQAGLYEDLTHISASAGLTRDNAAQMIYNAILADTMKLSWGQNMSTGEITQNWERTGDSIFADKYNGIESEGTVTDFDYDADKGEWTYTLNIDETTEGVTNIANARTTFKSTVDFTDLYRLNARILWTVKKNDVVVYGMYSKDNTIMAEGVLGDIDASKLAANNKEVKVGSTTYKTTNGSLKYYAFGAANYTGYVDGAAGDTAVAGVVYDVPNQVVAGDAYTMKLVDNTGDGKADIVIYVPFTFGKVTYVGSNNVNTSAAGYASLKLEDVNVYSGIAKDDYVMIVDAANSATETTTVTKADMVSGKVVKISGDKAMIGDTYYKVLTGVAAALGSEYDGAIINGYLFGTDLTKSDISVNDYAIVVAATQAVGLNGAQAKLMMSDGTTKIVDTDKDYSAAPQNYEGKLVTFEIDDDEYKLTPAGVDTNKTSANYCGFEYANATGTYAYSSVKGYGTINDNTIDDAAVIFYYNSNKDSWSVITGAELKKTTSGITAVTNVYGSKNSSTGYVTVEAAVVTGNVAAASDAQYGYLVADPVKVQDSDKNDVYELTIWTGSETVTLTSKSGTDSTTAATLKKGTAFSYKLTDGLVSNIAAGTVGAVTAYNNKDVTIAKGNLNATNGTVDTTSTVKTYIDDDTVIIYVNRADLVGEAGGAVQMAIETSTTGTYYANASYVLSTTADADGNYALDMLVVEIANNWYNVDIA